MGISFQCPECKKKHSLKSEKCSCGKSLKKLPNKHYWIDYRVHGKRVRESIGTSKLSAENRLREVKTQIVEDRYIKKDAGKSITMAEIYDWYMSLSEVIQLETYKTLKSRLGHTIRIIGSSVHVSSLSLDDIERYRRERSGDKSRWVKSGTIRPSTINKEISALKSMLNLAVNYKKIEKNPILKAKLLNSEKEKKDAEQAESRKIMVGSGDRSEKIRTYNFPQNRITDHRIEMSVHNLAGFLDGDMEVMISSLLEENQARALANLEKNTT